MGCTASTQISEDENDPFLQSQRANDAIEQSLQREKQKDKNEIKLLLLGAGESGKSTVLKQLKLLHQGGFNHQERLQYAQVIWADAIQSMKILIIQARKLGIPLDCDDPNKNPELFEFKRLLLSAKALDFINASIAGGSGFLNDYVLKYSERYETKRRIQSTGEAKGFDTNLDNNNLDMNGLTEINSNKPILNMSINEISKNLNDTGDDHMFVEKKTATATEKKLSREDIATAIQELWKNDSGIKQCFTRSNEFQLEGSAAYYFDNVHKFADPNYICTDEDILKGRIKTTGITENEFNIGSSKFKVLDAGGQRSERKKWIHSFQGITAVLFVLAMSEYDQMLFEDERVNRMNESIMLFDALLNSKWFRDTPFILFLNKMDLFDEKVKRMPIRKYFPDYQGRVGDSEAGVKYFEKIFLSLNKSNKPIYIRRTCATDTQSMKFVLSAVTDMIVQQNLKKSGII
ncbi:similar to Saccharomyces cerevisiae YHR005C GPA1 GTP-binding alpha subunit of the heterotrimeric G protein that couples to pheromone receptors [Maudiozyma barnettii]|uniref:Guanine nucleotide-binding protein alpha-1 subunit n=1 Tax=Maudiozyma barnettii TaxID=61262 RepID=A0A8H2VJN6_9SACH|nr:guanine nucleotide-binding protein subunit alpha [Kazachstania barnettii]CAB4256662.1 similar to Saccharomyces cerevisiae YHR005C GPA1 GTP-binding alpha subunit of the heterotrimeric G protein that couples to pheromone receptors [Kazachstania barnettii]CAD1785317.1 similar to Saccharomyces cerevisiae YHR005C GPA1 GTP-binding alpha subunit of the heterotrimeric G protein that couples to pheromone receptors [Kazachstania barnettii]